MADMDWDRILSTLRKGREQLQSLRIGNDEGKTQPEETATVTTETPDSPQDQDT